MPIYCQKDSAGVTCTKEKISPEKSTEAKVWLNMMSSMLNFAMASTSLMKSIQNRVEVTRKIEEEARAMRAEEFFRKELIDSMAEFKGDSDYSLRSEPVRDDTCGDKTCTLFPKNHDIDPCGTKVDNTKTPKKSSQPRSKKKKPVESVATIGGSCECVVTFPDETVEMKKTEEVEEEYEKEFDEETENNDNCICEPKDCEDIIEDQKLLLDDPGDEMNEKGDKQEEIICPANLMFDLKSDDCSCSSLQYKEDNIVTTQPPPVEESAAPAESPSEEGKSIQDCGCQTTSSEEIMVKELQLANLAYQLRQTDRNLRELKREMDRISNFVGGKKKSHYDTAAALYEEIMKPRTSLENTITTSPRKKR